MAVAAPPVSRACSEELVAYVYELMDRGRELDRDELLEQVCEDAFTLVGADVVALWDADATVGFTAERSSDARLSRAGITLERQFVAHVLSEGTPVASTDGMLRPGLAHLCERLRREHSGAACVPLRRRNELLGALCLHRVGTGSFEGYEVSCATQFASFAALALFQLTEYERAQRDEVTGMPGRTVFLRTLDDWLKSKRPFGLACIDFDGLKAVNDSLGYEAGNELIRAVAQAITGLLRPNEVVGRLHGRGGDEFVCLLDESEQASLDRRCHVLEAALDRAQVPPELATAYQGVSIGAALANSGTPAGDVFTAAENAMRKRKQERRS
jgi:diguanylate cyclase (GGDEF)-like protein